MHLLMLFSLKWFPTCSDSVLQLCLTIAWCVFCYATMLLNCFILYTSEFSKIYKESNSFYKTWHNNNNSGFKKAIFQLTKQKIYIQFLHKLEMFTIEHCKSINLGFRIKADNLNWIIVGQFIQDNTFIHSALWQSSRRPPLCFQMKLTLEVLNVFQDKHSKILVPLTSVALFFLTTLGPGFHFILSWKEMSG